MGQAGDIMDLSRALDLVLQGITSDLKRGSVAATAASRILASSFRGMEAMLREQRSLFDVVSKSLEGEGSGLAASTNRLFDTSVTLAISVSSQSMNIIERLITLTDQIQVMAVASVDIDQLAHKSRFMAFNARIETQRAGPSGATFKVLSDEIMRMSSATTELSLHIRAQVQIAKSCLDNIRHSADDLASHDMNSALESRKNLLRVMEEIDHSNRLFERTLEEVSGFILAAMRATQFDDLLTQLLEGSAKKIVSVGLLTKRAFSAVAQDANHETCLEIRAAAELMKELSGPGAVSQTSLASGDVELF